MISSIKMLDLYKRKAKAFDWCLRYQIFPSQEQEIDGEIWWCKHSWSSFIGARGKTPLEAIENAMKKRKPRGYKKAE